MKDVSVPEQTSGDHDNDDQMPGLSRRMLLAGASALSGTSAKCRAHAPATNFLKSRFIEPSPPVLGRRP